MNIINKKFIYKENIKIYGVLIFFLLFFCFVKAETNNLEVSLTISPGELSIGAPASLNLGQISISQTQQYVQGQFSDYFWVSDFRGSDSGYNTTIVSDGLLGPDGSSPLTGIYLMAGNGSTPELLAGTPGGVRINSIFSGEYYSIFDTPVTYIYRPETSNYGKINKYGDIPWIKIVIPPYTQPGMYSGTIYFDI